MQLERAVRTGDRRRRERPRLAAREPGVRAAADVGDHLQALWERPYCFARLVIGEDVRRLYVRPIGSYQGRRPVRRGVSAMAAGRSVGSKFVDRRERVHADRPEVVVEVRRGGVTEEHDRVILGLVIERATH